MVEPRRQPGYRPPSIRGLATAAAWGGGSAILAYILGRGTVVGMAIVFATLGIGVRVLVHRYHYRHR